MNIKKIVLGTALGLGVLLAASSGAKATLIAYEGFDYTPGESIGGKDGGIGWKAPWLTGTGWDLATNVTGSLSYVDANGNALLTSGNSLLAGAYNTTTATKAARTLANFNADGTNFLSGGTYWISFIAQRVGPRNETPPIWDRQANFGLFANAVALDGQERFDVGRPNRHSYTGEPYDTWSTWHANGLANNGVAYTKPSSYPLENVTFVLVKIVTDNDPATGDSAYVWFNWPNLLSEPENSSAVLTDIGEVDLTRINQIRIHCNGSYTTGGILYTNALLWVDEIRIGTTFADVTPLVPEPSAIALSVLGGLGLLVWRLRRRQ